MTERIKMQPIGYGKGEVEPAIAPLVEAVQLAGLETFSSCEGHVDDRWPHRFPCVAFYAQEQEALLVHRYLLELRERLACSWYLQGGFVLHRTKNQWALGWAVENGGIIANGDANTFVARTVGAGREDIPTLIELFHRIR